MAITTEIRNYEYCVKSAVDDWSPISPGATVYGSRFDAIESFPNDALFEPLSTMSSDIFNATPSFGVDVNFSFVGDTELDSFFEMCLPNSSIKHEITDKPLNEEVTCFGAIETTIKDLPENPSLWTSDDCVRWLETTCSQFHLSIRAPAAYRRRIAAGGCALLTMSADEFCACLGDQTGSLLFTQLRLWNAGTKNLAFESTLSNSKESHLNGYFRAESSYCEPTTSASCQVMTSNKRHEFWTQNGASLNFDSNIKEVELSSNSSCISAENEGANDESFDEVTDEFYGLISDSSQPQHHHNEIFIGDRQALYIQSQQQLQLQQQFGCGEIYQTQLLSDSKNGYPNYYVKKPTDELCNQMALRRYPSGRRLPEGMPPSASSGTIHLWHFIRELLDHPLEYGYCVRWVNQNEGTFKIESSQNLAQIWGQRKNRSAMNYDKLSRSLRQYYKKGIIQKPEKKQRLVYRFLPPYHL